MLKTNSGLQQHIPGTINIEAYKQSRALEDATEWKLNTTLFIKLFYEKAIGYICVLASRNQKQWLSMPSVLPGTAIIYNVPPCGPCRLNISDDLQRQDKCVSCTRLVNPYWHLQLQQITNQDPLYFWLSLRNATLPHKFSK